jgi:hypothetical protein
MIRALLVVSVLLLKFGVSAYDQAKASNYMPEPDCPWPAPPDCEC